MVYIRLMDESTFIKAVKNGDEATVRSGLAENKELVHICDKDLSTPLHHAAWKGHAAILKLLLESGAEMDRHNENFHWGTTALHAASHGNRPECVKVLLEHGCDVNILKSTGTGTPLAETKIHNATAAAKVLRAAGATE
jgi:ankyrin repeat protein